LDRFKAEGVEYVGLDAVQEQVATYARRGFVDVMTKVHLMKREAGKIVPLPADMAIWKEVTSTEPVNNSLVPLSDVSADLLTKNDLQLTGLLRDQLWSSRGVSKQKQVWGMAMLGKDRQDLKGWAVVRPCDLGWRVGPLYGDTVDVAREVLRIVLKKLEDEPGSLIAEVWEANPEAVKLFAELGWEWAGVDYNRMWLNGKVPSAQTKGGKASIGMFTIFDAGEG
jgi:hypothetical protein